MPALRVDPSRVRVKIRRSGGQWSSTVYVDGELTAVADGKYPTEVIDAALSETHRFGHRRRVFGHFPNPWDREPEKCEHGTPGCTGRGDKHYCDRPCDFDF